MYRVGLEAILGFRKDGDTLTIRPRVPAAWPSYAITFRYRRSLYDIVVHDPGAVRDGEVALEIDGRAVEGATIALVDDGTRHEVIVRPRPR